jgi:formylglycine-generating enzyme required for sulfatase activity
MESIPGTKTRLSTTAIAITVKEANGHLRRVVMVGDAIQEFVWIAPGRFVMGSPPEDEYSSDTRHQVNITTGFWMADTACTQGFWSAVMRGENPSEFRGDPLLPVENVSYHQVSAFLERLNGMVGDWVTRLPTEAEWEYACRAGTQSRYSFGEYPTMDLANYAGGFVHQDAPPHHALNRTVPVKSLPPNPWGLYEMHGNVWEWCQDWHGGYVGSIQTDPTGPSEGSSKVIRGGSWGSLGWTLRSAHRGMATPNTRYKDIGFRIVLEP